MASTHHPHPKQARRAPQQLSAIRAALLQHYRAHARDLPWRQTRDPYAIWVSEIMLQQTQVDTVLPRYAAFLQRFPTIGALAQASAVQVCEAWAGLGYYQRARRLHAAALQVLEQHGGQLPRAAHELERLPGIGRYTAGAIASIAFDQPAPVVDGNVMRLFARLWRIDIAPTSAIGQRLIWDLAAQLVRGDNPGDLNQALMDLGATLCTPTHPQCPKCPLQRWCAAHKAGVAHQYPLVGPPPARQKMCVAFAWLQDEHGAVMLTQRPLEGLWAGLWELPSASASTSTAAKQRLEHELGQKFGRAVVQIGHLLTHRLVTAKLYACKEKVTAQRYTARGFTASTNPLATPLSGLARKVISAHLLRVPRPA